MKKQISGFSKLSKIEKIDWVTNTYFNDPQKAKNTLRDYWNSNIEIQILRMAVDKDWNNYSNDAKSISHIINWIITIDSKYNNASRLFNDFT